MNVELEKVADELRVQGKNVYTIPGGGSNPTGALGYVNCAFEMLTQFNERALKVDHIVHATGSAGTQAGLIAGLKSTHSSVPLLGIGVRAPKATQERMFSSLPVRQHRSLGVQMLLHVKMLLQILIMWARVTELLPRVVWRQSACLRSLKRYCWTLSILPKVRRA